MLDFVNYFIKLSLMETGVTGVLPASNETAAFRRFTRFYTRFIGTLQEGLLDTPYSLSEARVLYELATRRRPFAREITQELGMDAGYLSRILSKLEGAGLVKRAASLEDGRQTHLTLTKQGRVAFRNLNARSDRQARSILSGLAPVSRMNLIRSMRSICMSPRRSNVGFSGGADSGSGSGDSSASAAAGGRTGNSSVPLKICKVARSGPGQTIGQ